MSDTRCYDKYIKRVNERVREEEEGEGEEKEEEEEEEEEEETTQVYLRPQS